MESNHMTAREPGPLQIMKYSLGLPMGVLDLFLENNLAFAGCVLQNKSFRKYLYVREILYGAANDPCRQLPYSRSGRVWLVTSRLGKGKSLTLF